MRAAAVGIGSNSTRMLAAEIGAGQIAPFLRLREDTRLFSGLENGALSAERMMHTAATAAALVERARVEGCETLRLFATSATRDAKNGAEFRELVEALCGAPLEILSGEEEARLSFLGATGGAAGTGVLDIGGGSTELALLDGGHLKTISLQLGSSRLLQVFPDLTVENALRALDEAEAILRASVETLGVRETPRKFMSVGGNGYRLAVADRLRLGLDPEGAEGWQLTLDAVRGWTDRLCRMTVPERAQVPGLPASRAEVVAHGAVILYAAMRTLNLPAITATKRTNLDGALLEAAGKAV